MAEDETARYEITGPEQPAAAGHTERTERTEAMTTDATDTGSSALPDTAGRRRGPDPLTLLVGLATLAMAVFAFTGRLPDLGFVDPRWLLAGGATAVGLALLVGSLRRRPRDGRPGG